METKLSFKEIVPANDILEDEMEFVKGGTDLNLCFKGCITGEKSGSTTTQPTTSKPQTTAPTTQTTAPTTQTPASSTLGN